MEQLEQSTINTRVHQIYGPNLPICQIQEIFVILGEEKANALFERVNRQLLNKTIETTCIAMEEENENR